MIKAWFFQQRQQQQRQRRYRLRRLARATTLCSLFSTRFTIWSGKSSRSIRGPRDQRTWSPVEVVWGATEQVDPVRTRGEQTDRRHVSEWGHVAAECGLAQALHRPLQSEAAGEWGDAAQAADHVDLWARGDDLELGGNHGVSVSKVWKTGIIFQRGAEIFFSAQKFSLIGTILILFKCQFFFISTNRL